MPHTCQKQEGTRPEETMEVQAMPLWFPLNSELFKQRDHGLIISVASGHGTRLCTPQGLNCVYQITLTMSKCMCKQTVKMEFILKSHPLPDISFVVFLHTFMHILAKYRSVF